MKKKTIIIVIIIIIILALICPLRNLSLDAKYSAPNEVHFGEKYEEIFHIASYEDRKIANKVLAQVDEAFSFVGTKEEAQLKFGELARYSETNPDSVREEHKIKLVTAEFKENTGVLWFEYTQKSFDKNDKSMGGSTGILVRLELKLINSEWIVTDTDEAP